MTHAVIDWLMDGDPVIRWQVMRDLLDSPEEEWQAERARIPTEGWGAQFLEHRRGDGNWPKGRWTDTVWTLLLLMDCGMPSDQPEVRLSAERFVNDNLTLERANDPQWLVNRMDLCHLGFWLRIAAYFLPPDERFVKLSELILELQFEDGGWNCRKRNYPETAHSSFHTTFNVLEGLRPAAEAGIIDSRRFREREVRALEFMLAHRMYRSDHTGEVVDERFINLTYPSHWHYNVLRGLDYMRGTPQVNDRRLNDPIQWLESRRLGSGRWKVEKRIPGIVLFDMDKPNSESRWNTLRALRVLRARGRRRS